MIRCVEHEFDEDHVPTVIDNRIQKVKYQDEDVILNLWDTGRSCRVYYCSNDDEIVLQLDKKVSIFVFGMEIKNLCCLQFDD